MVLNTGSELATKLCLKNEFNNVIFEKKMSMDRIIIDPRDKEEMNFFLELAKRLGVDARTYEDLADEALLDIMEKNKRTPYIDSQKVKDTLNDILNEQQDDYSK